MKKIMKIACQSRQDMRVRAEKRTGSSTHCRNLCVHVKISDFRLVLLHLKVEFNVDNLYKAGSSKPSHSKVKVKGIPTGDQTIEITEFPQVSHIRSFQPSTFASSTLQASCDDLSPGGDARTHTPEEGHIPC